MLAYSKDLSIQGWLGPFNNNSHHHNRYKPCQLTASKTKSKYLTFRTPLSVKKKKGLVLGIIS